LEGSLAAFSAVVILKVMAFSFIRLSNARGGELESPALSFYRTDRENVEKGSKSAEF
jgi:hypothetical protein